MNSLTSKIARYEVEHGCLGPEIDSFVWLYHCPPNYGRRP